VQAHPAQPEHDEGKAVPSFKPASPLSATRSPSPSSIDCTWMYDANTGSVGASTAPNSTAKPQGTPSG